MALTKAEAQAELETLDKDLPRSAEDIIDLLGLQITKIPALDTKYKRKQELREIVNA